MKQIATIYCQDVYPGAPLVDVTGFDVREAARAVVFDGQKVALLYAATHGFYKLPGGGIEVGEDIATGLAREVLEEIGCRIRVTGEIGQTTEFRDAWRLKQHSYCYLADKVGRAATPQFTPEERADGFEVVWADNVEQATELVRRASGTGYEAPFIQRRDTLILESARRLMGESRGIDRHEHNQSTNST